VASPKPDNIGCASTFVSRCESTFVDAQKSSFLQMSLFGLYKVRLVKGQIYYRTSYILYPTIDYFYNYFERKASRKKNHSVSWGNIRYSSSFYIEWAEKEGGAGGGRGR
jgi:hypothetical protein